MSIPIQRRFSLSATAMVVPQPQKGSSDVALVAAAANNALQQGLWLLGGVAEPLSGSGADGPNIGPDVLKRHTRHFVKVPFISGHATQRRLHHAPLANEPLHGFLRIAPIACNAHHFVARIPPPPGPVRSPSL